MFHRDEFIMQPLRLLPRSFLQQPLQRRSNINLRGTALHRHFGGARQEFFRAALDLRAISPQTLKYLRAHTLRLLQQGKQQVFKIELSMLIAGQHLLGKRQRLFCFISEFAEVHLCLPLLFRCFRLTEFGLQGLHARLHLAAQGLHLLQQLEDHSHPRQVYAPVLGELLYVAKPLDVPFRVEPLLPKAGGTDQAFAFIKSKALGMHAHQAGCDTDYIYRLVCRWFTHSHCLLSPFKPGPCRASRAAFRTIAG